MAQRSTIPSPYRTPPQTPTPRASRAARHQPPPTRSRARKLLRIGLWFVVPLLAVGVGSIVGLIYAMAKVPLVEQVPAAQAVVFKDAKGREIGTLAPNENRRIVPLAKIPKVMQQAVLAAEDRDFYNHGAVSYRGMLRATFTNVSKGEVSQGGSTITQQYVKNAYPTVGRDRTLFRKLKESVVAVKLEKRYTKDEILGFYLNTVYFGKGAYGVEAASRAYFGHGASKLTVAKAALLAGNIRSPEYYSKKENAEATKARRNFVIQVMRDKGWITQKQAAGATRAPTGVHWAPKATGIANSAAPYFLDKVREYLVARYGEARVEQGGFQVKTTIDMDMQKQANETVKEVLDQAGDPKAALVAIDPKTGAVRAMYGGRNFAKQQLNYATDSRRQVGSTFKPMVLQQALLDGYSPYSLLPGPPVLEVEGKEYHNFGDQGYGLLTLMDATKYSVNTAYVQLIERLGLGPEGLQQPFRRRLEPGSGGRGARRVAEGARRIGLDDVIVRPTKEHRPLERQPALPLETGLALGSGEASTLQLASAFGTWANQGVHHEAYMVEEVRDSSGNVLERHKDVGTQVLDPNIANTITSAMRGGVEGGTGTRARLPDRQVAGKTGTTNDAVDARFVGYTPDLVTSVWMGYENKTHKRKLENVHGFGEVSGGTLPAMIWQAFMLEATRDQPPRPFPEPRFGGFVLNSTTTTTVPSTTFPPITIEPPIPGPLPPTTLPGPFPTLPATTGPDPLPEPDPTSGDDGRQGRVVTTDPLSAGSG